MENPRLPVSQWRQATATPNRSDAVRKEDIAARAYAKYLRRPDLRRGPLGDWLDAERELLREAAVAKPKD